MRPRDQRGADYLNWNHISAIADSVISTRASTPNMFDPRLFTAVPMILGLLHICNTSTIITGDVSPYKMAVYSRACMALI